MIIAERDNVPVPVAVTIFLYMGSNFWFLDAALFWTMGRNCLTAEIFPVIKPASATTGVITRAVDVIYPHIVFYYLFII